MTAHTSQAQLMKTEADAPKLKANEQLFVNKPLHVLLQEIGPAIKMVSANPSSSNQTRLGYFIFRFVDSKKYDSCKYAKKYPLQITVFVKEPFVWDLAKKPAGKKFDWTPGDVAKYKNLTVVGIRLFEKK
jgi:hypothetical protein